MNNKFEIELNFSPIEFQNLNPVIYIVKTEWHKHYVNLMQNFIETYLNASYGIKVRKVITVPGCWDIPLMVQHILKNCNSHLCCIIPLGIVLKGETEHFQIVANNVSKSLMDLQLKFEKPILHSILVCYNEKQIKERITHENMENWAKTALKWIELQKNLLK